MLAAPDPIRSPRSWYPCRRGAQGVGQGATEYVPQSSLMFHIGLRWGTAVPYSAAKGKSRTSIPSTGCEYSEERTGAAITAG